MTEETKKKIFTDFFTTKPKGKGTGLGLTNTIKIIKEHNFELSFDSEYGIGTKFTIKIKKE